MLEHLNVIDQFQKLKKNETLKGSVIEKYKAARVARLRELYTLYEPLLEKRCTYEHPNDARHNCYGMFPANENAMNSPFDLPDFESQMPQLEVSLEGTLHIAEINGIVLEDNKHG